MKTKVVGLTETMAEDFFDDLKKLFSLSADQIRSLNNYLVKENIFDVTEDNENLIDDIANELKIETKNLVSVLRVSKFIYKRVKEKNIADEDLVVDLNNLSKEVDSQLTGDVIDALKLLFQKKERYDLLKRINDYKRGIIPSVLGITTICDIRAVYDEDNNKIIKYLPVIICRVRSIDDENEKKAFSFQFTEKSLKIFKTQIDKSIENLEQIKELLKSKIDLFEEESEEEKDA